MMEVEMPRKLVMLDIFRQEYPSLFSCSQFGDGLFATPGNLDGYIESCSEYREMARRYETVVLRGLAGRNRVRVVRSIGAAVFDVSVDQLIAHTRDAEMTAIRQKLMAFAFVTTGASFGRIGEEFNRDHSAVSYAYDKYGSAVRAALAE